MPFLSGAGSVLKVVSADMAQLLTRYGYGPNEFPITQATVLALQYQGQTKGTILTSMDFTVPINPEPDTEPQNNSYGYFAYPKAWGKTQFLDATTGFYGGWDGALWDGPNDDSTDASRYGAATVEVNVPGFGLVEMYVYKNDNPNLGELKFTAQPDDGSGYAT